MEVTAALQQALAKVRWMSDHLTQFPHITKNGEWLTNENGHWTGGFWIGLMWISSFYGEQPEVVRDRALTWAKRLQQRTSDNKTHDMGFLFGPSCVMGYRLIGDIKLKEMALSGARNMTDLYEPKVGLILAWDEPGYEGNAIVDTIMNVPLLVWAAEQLHNDEYRRIACRVADRIMQEHVRQDASIYHMVKWDTTSFAVVERTTHQGFAADTCWSRGQAWALYGFANLYRYTNERRYLDTSVRLAEYFWEHLDTDTRLPRWDFVFQDQPDQPIDASAASIAASGMLLLGEQLAKAGKQTEAEIWMMRGEEIVRSLADRCLYAAMEQYGIIEKATVDKPRNSGVQESTMYGDYYFVEALFRIVNRGNPDLLGHLY
ncbi:MAG TPA: glycoside hydrolase family 88 protein [Bacilli bacterium]